MALTLGYVFIFALSFYLIISSLYAKYATHSLLLPMLSFCFGIIHIIPVVYSAITHSYGLEFSYLFLNVRMYYVSRLSFAVAVIILFYFFTHFPQHLYKGLALALSFFVFLFAGSFFVPIDHLFGFVRSHTLNALFFNLANHILIPSVLAFAFYELSKIRNDMPHYTYRILVIFGILYALRGLIDMLFFRPFSTPPLVGIVFEIIGLSLLVIGQIESCILRPYHHLSLKTLEAQQLLQERSNSLVTYSKHVEKLESVMKDQLDNFQKIISIYPEPFLICVHSTIYQANPSAVKLFNADSHHSLIGTDLLSYIRDVPHLNYHYAKLIENPGSVLEGQATLALSNDLTYPIEYVFTATTLYTTPSVVCILRNVSSKYESQSAKQALQRQQLKMRYFSSLSHDIKTPINIIYSALQMQTHAINLSECTHYTGMMQTSCLKLLKLLNNLLDLTKIDNQMFTMHPQLFNLVDAVESLCDVSSHYIHSKGLTYTFDTEEDEKYVYIDAHIIERIVLNLISNAIKYTPKGGTLDITLTFDDDSTFIHIKDTGIGIPKEKLDFIFNRYTMLDAPCNFEHSSGIGLSIVTDLLDLINGNISCTSELGKGSEFIVRIPTPPIDQSIAPTTYDLLTSDQSIKIEFCDI